MMGINIPDMVQIIKEHGLVPIPVDYNLDTMHPKSFDDVRSAITDKVIFNFYLALFRQNVFCLPICLVSDMILVILLRSSDQETLMCLKIVLNHSVEQKDSLEMKMLQ
jgi:hypothetical protein